MAERIVMNPKYLEDLLDSLVGPVQTIMVLGENLEDVSLTRADVKKKILDALTEYHEVEVQGKHDRRRLTELEQENNRLKEELAQPILKLDDICWVSTGAAYICSKNYLDNLETKAKTLDQVNERLAELGVYLDSQQEKPAAEKKLKRIMREEIYAPGTVDQKLSDCARRIKDEFQLE